MPGSDVELCLGGNVFGWTIDEAQSFAVLDAFRDAGGRFIDTADVYSSWAPGNRGGESERIIGRWLASRGGRDEMRIATKVGAPMPDGTGLSREWIRAAVEASRRRLGVETIDLLYAHRDDRETPLDETLGAFDELVQLGHVRQLGASNYDAARLEEALGISAADGLASFEVLQPYYNLLERDTFEGELQQACIDHHIKVAPYYALASGFLTGKYSRDGELPSSPRAHGAMRQYGTERGWMLLDAVRVVAGRHGATAAQVSIAWLVTRDAVFAPIASATSVDQLVDLLAFRDLELSDADLQLLESPGEVPV